MKNELMSLLPGLRRYCMSLCGSVADADDLLQSTVERLLTKGVPDAVELDRWAFRVCRNLWIDEYRSRKVRHQAGFSAELSEQGETNGDRAIHASLQLEEVGKAIQDLPQEQHVVLSMVAVQGLSYKAVAAALEIPVGTVMSRLSRARAALIEKTAWQMGEA